MLPKGHGDEDVDAIESEFFTFKGKAKTRQYMPNKVLELYLGISHAKRTEIDNHIEEFKSKLSNTLEITTNSVSVSYQVFTCLCPSELSWHWLFQKKKMDIGSDRNLFLEDSICISQVDEVVPGPSAKENRLVRKRQRSEVSVSKLIIFRIIRNLTSKNRNQNFHHPLYALGLVSPAFGHKWSKTLNEKTHWLRKICDKPFKRRQHLQGRWWKWSVCFYY